MNFSRDACAARRELQDYLLPRHRELSRRWQGCKRSSPASTVSQLNVADKAKGLAPQTGIAAGHGGFFVPQNDIRFTTRFISTRTSGIWRGPLLENGSGPRISRP